MYELNYNNLVVLYALLCRLSLEKFEENAKDFSVHRDYHTEMLDDYHCTIIQGSAAH